MSKTQSTAGTVDVDGFPYEWRLQHEPHLSDDEGWRGMTISLLRRDAKREAHLEFPPPKRLLKGLPRGRLQLDEPTISRGFRAALAAGWNPCRATSRSCSWSTPKAIEASVAVA